jgi:hypothetical protein
MLNKQQDEFSKQLYANQVKIKFKKLDTGMANNTAPRRF